MRNCTMLCLTLVLTLSVSAGARSTHEDDVHRIQESSLIFQEILAAPDRAIPQNLLDSATCIAIIPAELRIAFFFGANYGKGLVTCRAAKSWSPPVFISIGGGGFGLQFGGSATDYILVFRRKRGLEQLLNDKFRIGGDISAAAGPVGRSIAAGTDIALRAEIVTYSRSRGIFAGFSLNGAVLQADEAGNRAFYGANLSKHDILDGKVAVPQQAMVLLNAVSLATPTPAPSAQAATTAAKTP